MKHLTILTSLLLLVAFDGWAYNESDLIKLKALNECNGCDLSGANLSGADLNLAELNLANLSNANLRGASFYYASLRYANLEGAYLNNADLPRADLNNANLRGANFTGASLRNAQLNGAKYCKTKMPWGELNDHCELVALSTSPTSTQAKRTCYGQICLTEKFCYVKYLENHIEKGFLIIPKECDVGDRLDVWFRGSEDHNTETASRIAKAYCVPGTGYSEEQSFGGSHQMCILKTKAPRKVID